jgi:hypothetical protein
MQMVSIAAATGAEVRYYVNRPFRAKPWRAKASKVHEMLTVRVVRGSSLPSVSQVMGEELEHR